MVKALYEPGAGERFGDNRGRRLTVQFLNGNTESIGRVDDRLALPVRDQLRDFAMFPERNGQEDDVGRDGVLQRLRDNGGADRFCAGWRRSLRCSFLQTLGRAPGLPRQSQ